MLRRLALALVSIVSLPIVGCATMRPAPRTASSEHPALPRDLCAQTVTLYAWHDLPRHDPRSHGLSAIAWDATAHVLRAVGDKTPAVQTLVPDERYKTFRFGPTIAVELDVEWDVEGLAVAPDRFYLGNEEGPWVHEVTREGKLVRRVPLPDAFQNSRDNHGLESLTLAPDGHTLILANEHAFTVDGDEGDATRGTTVRLVRIDLAADRATQRSYTTDPVFAPTPGGRVGVVDVMAPAADTLYVTERAYVPDVGNSVRVYCIDNSPDKKLLVDFVNLPDEGVPVPQGPQRNRILENFEGLALGPTLADGRRLVFAVSDDNGSPRQTPRIVVLAFTPRR